MNKFKIVLLVSVLLLVLIGLVVVAIYLAPVFTYSLLGISAMSLFYIFTERWKTHDAVEFENRFWSSIAFLFAVDCAFAKDSPMRLPVDQPFLSWTVVVTFTFLVHNYERHLRRLYLSKVPNIKRIQSAEFASENRVNAKAKLAELRHLLSLIDQRWLSSTFQNMFLLPRVVYIENRIISIFAEANTDELNLIMMNIELGLILYKVKDHRMSRQMNRTKLLHTLVNDRMGEMNISARAMLLDGLQRMKVSAHHLSDDYVKQIIMKTKGDELSELKSITDNKGDVNSMHKLIYVDIRNESIKRDILKYISEQARIQASHSTMRTKAGRRRGQYAWRKILSDVDDTLSCSGGSWPAGIDTSFPKKAIYPGVIAFYKELDLGTEGDDEWDPLRLGNLVFLSARPHVYKDVSENVTYQKFRWLQETRGLHTSPTLLAGSLDTGGQFMVKGHTEPLAIKKFENFCEYLTLYPEYSCIFVGDNGQGDVRTAEMVLSDSRYRDNLRRVYIHEIQPLYMTYAKNESTKARDNDRICYFNTYVDAAIDAHAHKLIRSSGLRRIMEAAVRDYEYIPLSAWTHEHTQDITERPPTTFQLPSVPPQGIPQLGPKERRKSVNSLQRRNHQKSALFSQESNREKRLRELNRSISKGNAILSKGGFGSVRLLKFTARFAVGSPVVTLLGSAIVTRFRPSDGMYEVTIQWDTTGDRQPVKAFLTGSALLSPIAPTPIPVLGSTSGRNSKNPPLIKTAVGVVKLTALPKPVPTSSVRLKNVLPITPTVINTATAPSTSPLNTHTSTHTHTHATPPSAIPLSSKEETLVANVSDKLLSARTNSTDSDMKELSLTTDDVTADVADLPHSQVGSDRSLPLTVSPLGEDSIKPDNAPGRSDSVCDGIGSPQSNVGTSDLSQSVYPLPSLLSSFSSSPTFIRHSSEKLSGLIDDFTVSSKSFESATTSQSASLPVTPALRTYSFPTFACGSRERGRDSSASQSERSLLTYDVNSIFTRPRTQSLRTWGGEALSEKLGKIVFFADQSESKEFDLKNEKMKLKEKGRIKSKVRNVLNGKSQEEEFEEILKNRLIGIRGSRVWTPYGLGVIAGYRTVDDKVEVLLQWGAICYSNRDSVVQLTDPAQTLSYIKIIKKMIVDEEKEKEEKRIMEEKSKVEEAEVAKTLKQKLILLKEFEENKNKIEKSMNQTQNKNQSSTFDKLRLSTCSTTNSTADQSLLSPERMKRMSIIAISRALSPLNMLRIEPQSQTQFQATNNNNKNDVLILDKNLEVINLHNMIEENTDIQTPDKSSLLGTKNPRNVAFSNASLGGQGLAVDSVEKIPASNKKVVGNIPSIFSRGWMNWPSMTQTNTTSNSTLNTPSEIISEIAPNSLNSAILTDNLMKLSDERNESPSKWLNGLSVRTSYGMGIIRNIRIEVSPRKKKQIGNGHDLSPLQSHIVESLNLTCSSSLPDLSPLHFASLSPNSARQSAFQSNYVPPNSDNQLDSDGITNDTIFPFTDSTEKEEKNDGDVDDKMDFPDWVISEGLETDAINEIEENTMKDTVGIDGIDRSRILPSKTSVPKEIKSSFLPSSVSEDEAVLPNEHTYTVVTKPYKSENTESVSVTCIVEVELISVYEQDSIPKGWGRAFLSPDNLTVLLPFIEDQCRTGVRGVSASPASSSSSPRTSSSTVATALPKISTSTSDPASTSTSNLLGCNSPDPKEAITQNLIEQNTTAPSITPNQKDTDLSSQLQPTLKLDSSSHPLPSFLPPPLSLSQPVSLVTADDALLVRLSPPILTPPPFLNSRPLSLPASSLSTSLLGTSTPPSLPLTVSSVDFPVHLTSDITAFDGMNSCPTEDPAPLIPEGDTILPNIPNIVRENSPRSPKQPQVSVSLTSYPLYVNALNAYYERFKEETHPTSTSTATPSANNVTLSKHTQPAEHSAQTLPTSSKGFSSAGVGTSYVSSYFTSSLFSSKS